MCTLCALKAQVEQKVTFKIYRLTLDSLDLSRYSRSGGVRDAVLGALVLIFPRLCPIVIPSVFVRWKVIEEGLAGKCVCAHACVCEVTHCAAY